MLTNRLTKDFDHQVRKTIDDFGSVSEAWAEFTIPSTFTIRLTLSRLPSAARVAASRLRPVARAA
jgi:hypothetical protein